MNKNTQISIVLRGCAKDGRGSCGAMLPSAGQRKNDAVVVSSVDATAPLAAFHAELKKKKKAGVSFLHKNMVIWWFLLSDQQTLDAKSFNSFL